MSSDQQEKFNSLYQQGQAALEKGQYRLSLAYLQEAQELIPLGTKLGGELQMWLITAYQALNEQQDAIALCQKLTTHPHSDIRKQAKNLLFIIQAPKLNRPQAWMSKIPDLAEMSESKAEDRYGKLTNLNYSPAKKQPQSKLDQPLDLFTAETNNSYLIWFILIAIVIAFGSLILLN